ncbi:hypothetical protein KIH74_12980 [Kineosporia sp. J2-2]|uniref:UvrD-like helicase ATP-binding domain-containing protein n=1 Tax=Kineosporia corallincola TaxID=2835133 RepID=A0ABS5THH3_9ACTN|nr:RNA polymerase recycling motor ATPase HelR [Kineosporia corallincola]MBT0769844.1 hypothetical protein [Kineosporia corallincola]
MNTPTRSAFALPGDLRAKADPALIGSDERHFAAIEQTLEQSIGDLSARLDEQRRAPGGGGPRALERDTEIHRLTARLRTLRRFGLDLCLGRMVPDGNGLPAGERAGEQPGEPVYVGRLGLTDRDGRRLLHDWRSPVAEPFFGATHGNPMGLASRRRYRWTRGRISDYWDEVFTAEGLERAKAGHAALDDQSAFIAGLGENRSPRMRDVLATIQADQDAIIRAGSRGTLVVDGGPGTGKTVVALHRSAYLLYSDPRLGHRRGGILFVGPHQPYLDYVSDVLPSLGEEGVQTCTLRDLTPEGASARPETDPEVARLKSSAHVTGVIDAAVRFYEDPPAEGLEVSTPWGDAWIGPGEWAAAFAAPPPGTPHNEAPAIILDELTSIVAAQYPQDDGTGDDATTGEVSAPPSPELLRRALRQNEELAGALNRAWPYLEPGDLVADLWSVPAYLRRCAPHLDRDQVRLLQRPRPRGWTESDLPFLDAARHRLGDPAWARRRERQQAAIAAEAGRRADVAAEIVQADDDFEGAVTMLTGQDLKDALIDEAGRPTSTPDRLAGPFAHVVVDEAQELTDAQWQMLLLRNPSRSFTVVGDRAQASHGFTGTWRERLERAGLDRIELASLSVNYRTPEEVMTEAEPVIRAVLPDANVPTSIRRSGLPVVHGSPGDLTDVLDAWLEQNQDGTACVIGDFRFRPRPRVRSLTPELAKGLEFDLVVLVDPEKLGAVDRYVAMTRATRQLVVLSDET